MPMYNKPNKMKDAMKKKYGKKKDSAKSANNSNGMKKQGN